MATDNEEPTFQDTQHRDVITGVALRLISYRGSRALISGTAVVVGPNLLLTAAHVVEHHWETHESRPIKDASNTGSYQLLAYQAGTPSQPIAGWLVRKIHTLTPYDLALLVIVPANDGAMLRKLVGPQVSVTPPALGSRLFAFGYRESEIECVELEDIMQLEFLDHPTTATGTVEELHLERRDSSLLKFPCFRTNARFDAGMSGGPIIGENGTLVGIVATGTNTGEQTASGLSYGSLLWPVLGISLEVPRQGLEEKIPYLAYELARDGVMPTIGWQNAIVEENHGRLKVLGFNCGAR